MEKKVVSPNSSLLDELPPSSEIDMEDILNYEDPLTLTGFLLRTTTKGMLR